MLSSITKKNVVLQNSGLVMSFDQKTANLNLSIKGYDILVPIDYSQLEIVSFLNITLQEAHNGYVHQNAWENPVIKLEGSLNKAQRISLAYYIMLSFINNSEFGTRSIWLVFRDVHHSLLSYLRNRAVASPVLLKYKVAILICYLKKYNLTDIDKIERTFVRCGLSSQNYIFYLLFLLDGTLDNIVFHTQDKFILNVESMEREKQDFINDPQIARLCMYHTGRKLSFIVKSHKISPMDMVQELQMATQIAYTTVRPLRSREYSENYARRSMTNMVNRIIHAYTTYEGNIRLVDRDKATHVSFSDIMVEGGSSKFDPLWNDACMDHTVSYTEDSMISYLDAKRVSAA